MNESEKTAIKSAIKKWIIAINKKERLPQGIIALNFGLYEPYGIELIGSKNYDLADDDWACNEDFEPTQRYCPNIKIAQSYDWEIVLQTMVDILKELVLELTEIELLQVAHITTGFCDGDLVIVK